MPDSDPVHAGDRLLLHPLTTSLRQLTWAEVELVEYVQDPGPLPWNAGPTFPYRVGYRVLSSDGGMTHQRGTLWLDAGGHDPVVGVRRIDARTGGPAQ
ncbi:MAG: hypothetical protein ABWX92_03585 [Mycetocola sp.]